jgi:flagellar basal body rod protein FlgF
LLLSVAKSEVKRSKKRLFHFALKQNEKNWKQNEAKIKIIGSESKRKNVDFVSL